MIRIFSQKTWTTLYIFYFFTLHKESFFYTNEKFVLKQPGLGLFVLPLVIFIYIRKKNEKLVRVVAGNIKSKNTSAKTNTVYFLFFILITRFETVTLQRRRCHLMRNITILPFFSRFRIRFRFVI